MKTITKEKFKKALDEFVDNLWGEDAPKNVMEVTTFEEVCKIAGEDPAGYIIPANATKRQRGKILYSMLELICDVFKEGKMLDYTDGAAKYYPWGDYSAGSGFGLACVGGDYTFTRVGARLSVDTRSKAEHIWKHFNYIYQDYWQDK